MQWWHVLFVILCSLWLPIPASALITVSSSDSSLWQRSNQEQLLHEDHCSLHKACCGHSLHLGILLKLFLHSSLLIICNLTNLQEMADTYKAFSNSILWSDNIAMIQITFGEDLVMTVMTLLMTHLMTGAYLVMTHHDDTDDSFNDTDYYCDWLPDAWLINSRVIKSRFRYCNIVVAHVTFTNNC